MKNINERTEFEDEWQKAFEQAELKPSEEVWSKVDAFMANHKADKYKKSIFFYRMTAAASVLLAIMFGLISYFQLNQVNNTTISQLQENSRNEVQQKDYESAQEQASNADPGSGQTAESLPFNNNNDQSQMQGSPEKNFTESFTDSEKEQLLADADQAAIPEPTQSETTRSLGIGQTAGTESIDLTFTLLDNQPQQLLPVDLEPSQPDIYASPLVEELFAKNEQTLDKGLFAGVSLASGIFDPRQSSGGGFFSNESADYFSNRAQLSLADGYTELAEEDPEAPGVSRSLGLNLGARISKRWVLETGLLYIQNSSNTSSDILVVDQANNIYPVTESNSAAFAKAIGNINYSSQVDLDNSFEYASIPLKVGYVLLDKTIALTFSAGVATDIFIRNDLNASERGIQDITLKPGDDSPYRNVYFNGLVSTDITYRFSGKRYSVSLSPTYRMSLTSMTKGDQFYQNRPQVFNLGVGLKYHFN
ncbi:MAG: hypothetical protein ACNS62_19320 [Candidatus Cyclobacteriaceae bacterium M3_2C_046]